MANKKQRKGGSYHHPIWDELKRQGRRQIWVHQATGYSYGHIRSMACGRMPTSRPFAVKLAALMGINLDSLTSISNEEPDKQGAA